MFHATHFFFNLSLFNLNAKLNIFRQLTEKVLKKSIIKDWFYKHFNFEKKNLLMNIIS